MVARMIKNKLKVYAKRLGEKKKMPQSRSRIQDLTNTILALDH